MCGFSTPSILTQTTWNVCRPHVSRLRTIRLSPRSDTSSESKSSGFLTDGLLIRESHHALPQLDNLLEWPKELRKNTLVLLACDKGYNSGKAKWKTCIGQGIWEGVQSFHRFSGYNIFSAPWWVHQPASSLSLFALGFSGGYMIQA